MDRFFSFQGLAKALKRAVDLGEDFENKGIHAERIVAGKDQHKIFAGAFLINQAKSAAIDLGTYRAVGLKMPLAFDGATISFEASVDNVNFGAVYLDGEAVSTAVAASQWIVIDPASLYGVRYLKLVASTNQLAARTVQVIAEA